ncbi:response regulator [Hyphococcus sp.]|uniref:response regulator n=1 Tax=Hyphococcus sp. TaxID=2038636 RepID=UPI003D0A3213
MSDANIPNAEHPSEEDAARPPVILIAEDNDVNLKVLEHYLANYDCKAIIAKNGKDAVKLFHRNDVDLVLMDIMMPVMDGLEATRKIRMLERKRGADKRTPIVAITAHIKPADQHLCINAGMNDYLSKPLKKDDLTKRMKIWAPHLREGPAPQRASA